MKYQQRGRGEINSSPNTSGNFAQVRPYFNKIALKVHFVWNYSKMAPSVQQQDFMF